MFADGAPADMRKGYGGLSGLGREAGNTETMALAHFCFAESRGLSLISFTLSVAGAE